jgi:thymidylate synthase (FAD)
LKIVPQSAQLVWANPFPLQVIESAARTCYKSEDLIDPESAERLAQKLLDRGHHAMLEHISASLRFVTDRGISHEIVRHRLASYAQESTRYCNYTKDKFGNEITVIEPQFPNGGCRDDWYACIKKAETTYQRLIAQGVSPQFARSVLPTCLKTEIVVTANAREWRHILQLRLSPAAHPQMRELMEKAQGILHDWCPLLFPLPSDQLVERSISP